MSVHPLYPTFRALTSILAEEGIHFVLSGGTMLGAVRDGRMIAHDPDFDLELLAEDRERVLALGDRLAPHGLELKEKVRRGIRLADGVRVEEPFCAASNIHVRADGRHVGDLLLFTVFDDGIARRLDATSGTLYNPRMQIPAWYLEQTATAPLYGDHYPVVRDAELVLEVTYGTGWVRPIAGGNFPPGQNPASGATYDKPTERLVAHALAQGWDGDYRDRPHWPAEVRHVNSNAARRWVRRHEPELLPGTAELLTDDLLARVRAEPSDFRLRHHLRLLVIEGVKAGSTGQRQLAEERLAEVRAELDRTNARLERTEDALASTRTRLDRSTARLQVLDARLENERRKLRDLRRRPVRTVLAYLRRRARHRLRRAA